MSSKTINFLVVLAASLTLSVQARAADSSEPLHEKLEEHLKKPWLKVGLLLQMVGDYQNERPPGSTSGFSVGNARVSLGGDLDRSFSYFFQGTFAGNSALLDGYVGYRVRDALVINMGLKKTPFSAEFLTGAASIDLVNRSQVVTALAPNRQIGVELTGSGGGGLVRYSVGAFNGNRFAQQSTNDNNRLMGVARASLHPDITEEGREDDSLEIGVSVAHSDDAAASLGGGLLAGFAGTRRLLGVDARLTRGRLLLAAEAIAAELDFKVGPTVRPDGLHLTAGFMVRDNQQILVRWDTLSPGGLAPTSELIILGYNLWPSKPTELQVNYIIPTRGSGFQGHQVLVNLQVAF